MTVSLKRLFLVAITLLVIPLLGLSLWSSLTEPQITDRLQLYQTDLLLHVNELQVDDPQDANLLAARKAVLGNDPLKTALEQYQDVRQSAATNLQKFQQQLPAPAASDDPIAAPTAPIPSTQDKLQNSQTLTNIQKQSDLLQQLDLRIGLLQADQDNIQPALATWAKLTQSGNPPSQSAQLANVLTGLWSEPPQIFPNAEELLQKQLEGWFRYKALSRLYQLQQRTEALNTLEDQEQQVAQQTLVKLALVSTVPTLGAVIGVALIVWLSIRWLLGAGQSRETTGSLAWQVPWDWEVIAWVLIVGFFFAGQIAIPGLLGIGSRILSQVGISASLAAVGGRAKAFYTLTYYLLMAGTGLFVLYRAVKPFSPLANDWFRLTGKRNWFLWGLGGYFVALPLMFAVSLVNQQFWQGQGGSNPLLQIVLEEGDPVALLIFFFTAAVAAPIFEETLFRGFLLPSLTRYLPVWGAIGVSSLIFATAHLSLSEVLPLTTLGIVLGTVYTRSRGLLASMLLHSLWNSVTMIGLFILGSGVE
ncbi:CPBP family intramembrane metalloprotease [Leptolyngbya sp. NK1-12]|uniref:CPBP family intramembrane metalloprotease n=1 Tax=Leptolyngbya sp. NK1-12 TaxID=2547451 RepID=A0AA96WIM4_9CYAN|nr:CPBP family intramembrane metalloprotease [Leptolyngbya sp. NK1-12]